MLLSQFAQSTYLFDLTALTIIKGLFPIQIIREVPLAGRLQYFVNNWQILTKNPDILELVSGLRLSFIEEPIQNKPLIKPK